MSDSAVLIFWIVVMTAACSAFALIPLWRRSARGADNSNPLSSDSSNLAIWRDQRAELDRELEEGNIPRDEFDRSTRELALRAAPELTGRALVPVKSSTQRPWALSILVLAVTVALTTITYARIGAYRQSTTPPPVTAAGGPQITAAELNAMVEQLAAKLKENPSDARGWELMAHAESALGHFDAAVPAFERVMALRPPDATLLADYADADAMLHAHSLAGRPTASLERALQLDPSNIKALELAGTAALERHDVSGAIGYWSRLDAILPEGSNERAEVDQALQQLRGDVGAAGSGTSSPAPRTPPAPTSAGERGAGRGAISGRIDIATQLLSKVTLSDTVFVFARAVDASGVQSRMPLAVMRIAARELPRAFELTDAMAMNKGLVLSGASRVVVIARISKSGSAEARSGDLEGISMPIVPGARDVAIRIDHVVP